MNIDESTLIKQAKHGDKSSLEELYERNLNTLFRFVRFKTDTKEEAEDITAEAFIRAFESLKRFKEKSCFKTYVYAIAKNLIYESYKRKKYLSLDEARTIINEPEENLTENNDKQTKKELNSILSQLNEIEREIVELRYLSNFSVKETAEHLKLSEANVKVITHRALKKCRNFN